MLLSEKLQLYVVTLLKGAGYTIGITILTFCVAVIIGLVFGAIKAFGERGGGAQKNFIVALVIIVIQRLVLWMINIFVEVFRGLPALAVLFILYFGLAYSGLRLEPFTAAVLGLSLIGGGNADGSISGRIWSHPFRTTRSCPSCRDDTDGRFTRHYLAAIMANHFATLGQLRHRIVEGYGNCFSNRCT